VASAQLCDEVNVVVERVDVPDSAVGAELVPA
jgi:hypothetical protein